MGKGLDTCLVVKPIAKPSVAPQDVVIAQRKKMLLQLTSLNVQPQPPANLVRQVSISCSACRYTYTEK